MENLREAVHCVKEASIELASCSEEKRNNALAAIREALLAHKEEIFQKNREDLEAADRNGIADAVKKRLKFDEGKLRASAEGLESLIGLKDPIGKTQFIRELDEDLILTRVTCPIGVIGVIFEARPDALIQISALCLKSGNAAVLKGGKETASTNKILFTLIRDAAEKAGLPANSLLQAESHSEIDELLKCEKDVDLLIPRGSNAFVRYIMENTKIPVMGHADGVCHLYVDETADREKALKIILDAKTQYTAACNAVETILVHRKIAADFLPELAKAMKEAGVKLRGTKEAVALLDAAEAMEEDEFSTEYLSLTASVKIVDGVEEAVSHINRFGSHHTDGIVTEDDAAWAYFCQRVDSAGVYKNVSTRFADGFRYGFGAEVGISTGKIHARGPVGLEGLVTYKYLLEGKGQIVADYAEGRKQFHFRDLEG